MQTSGASTPAQISDKNTRQSNSTMLEGESTRLDGTVVLPA